MPIQTLIVLFAVLIQLCAGVDHMKNVGAMMKSHNSIMSAEFANRVTNGFKPTDAVHLDAISLSTVYSTTGFFYLTNSFDASCSSPAVSFGVPVDTCMVADNFAFKLQVVDDSCTGAVVEYFLDTSCTTSAGSNSAVHNSDLTCRETSTPVVHDGHSQGRGQGHGKVYSQLHCTNAAEPPRLSDIGAGIIEYFEDTATCAADKESIYLSYTANVCLGIDEFAYSVDCSHGSVRFTVDLDNTPNCVGMLGQIDYPDTCEADGDEQNDGDNTDDAAPYTPSFINPPPSVSTTPFPTTSVLTNSSQRATCQASLIPTAEPTAAPTRPTARPTARPSHTAFPSSATKNNAKFKAKQTINGISKAIYNSNVALYGDTLKQTIAGTMQGVTTDEITDLVISDSAARSHAVYHNALRSLQSSSLSAAYTVSANSAYTAAQLLAQLQEAVNSGDFTTALQLNAVSNGANGFEGASSDSVDPVSDSGGDSNAVLDTGAIIGIAIGGAAFIVIVIVIAYYACGAKSTSVVTPVTPV